MKIVVASDFHADLYTDYVKPAELKYGNNDRFKHQMEVLNEVYDIAERNDACVVLNGDLYNQRMAISPIVFTNVENIIKNRSEAVTTYINVGNHDQQDNTTIPANSVNSLSSPHVHVANTVNSYTLEDGSAIILVPYSEDVEWLKKNIKQVVDSVTENTDNVVEFAHVGVQGSVQGRWNHRLGGAFSLSDLQEDKVKAVVLGHYHKRQDLSEKTFYVGNTVPMNHNDDGATKGVYLVDTITGEHTYIPIHSPMFMTLDSNDIQGESDINDVTSQIETNYVKLLVHDKETLAGFKDVATKEDTNVNIALQEDITYNSRLDVDPKATEVEIVKAYTAKYHPDVADTALEILNKVVRS